MQTKHHRRSIRLQGYDYSQPGAYFVTLCIQGRECLFGEIIDGVMRLNEYGTIVREKWDWLAEKYPYVALDECIVMPNHFHGILWIRDGSCRGGSRPAPTETGIEPRTVSKNNDKKIKPVGQIIGAFKTVSAKQINICRSKQGIPVWQRDFYDHIGRNEKELSRIRNYIRNNPANWVSDEENPICISPRYVAMPNPQKMISSFVR